MTATGDDRGVGPALVARRDDIAALEAYHSPQLDVPGAAQHQREPVPAAA